MIHRDERPNMLWRSACSSMANVTAACSSTLEGSLIHLRVSDLDASKRFYRAVLESLDLPAALVEGADYFYANELFVDKASVAVSHVHLAFQARDRATAVYHGPAARSASSVVGTPAD